MTDNIVISATTRPGSKLGLVIDNADNELIAYLNTEQVYDRKTEGDPTFRDSVDLSSRLKHGHSSLVILVLIGAALPTM